MNSHNNLTSMFLSEKTFSLPGKPFFGVKNLESALKESQVDDFFCSLLLSRSAFRKHCGVLGLRQPEYFSSKDFSKISAWLIKHQNFPTVIKTDKNLEDCKGHFLLRAFRELPDFFEQVNLLADNSEVIIEPFFKAKGYIEATFFNEQVKMISQVSLTKELNFSHSWRMFPLKPPQAIESKILLFSQKLLPLIKIANIPIRLSFALTEAGITLCSVNAGWNRLEYFPEFSSDFGLSSLAMLEEQHPSPLYFRIQFIENLALDEEIDFSELKKSIPELLKLQFSGESCVFLLGSKMPLELSKAAKRLSTMLKKALAEPIVSDEE